MTAFPSYEPMRTTRGCSRESASATAVTDATFTCSRRARFWIGPRLSLAGHVSFCQQILICVSAASLAPTWFHFPAAGWASNITPSVHAWLEDDARRLAGLRFGDRQRQVGSRANAGVGSFSQASTSSVFADAAVRSGRSHRARSTAPAPEHAVNKARPLRRTCGKYDRARTARAMLDGFA